MGYLATLHYRIQSTVSIKGSFLNLLLIIPLSHHGWVERSAIVKKIDVVRKGVKNLKIV